METFLSEWSACAAPRHIWAGRAYWPLLSTWGPGGQNLYIWGAQKVEALEAFDTFDTLDALMLLMLRMRMLWTCWIHWTLWTGDQCTSVNQGAIKSFWLKKWNVLFWVSNSLRGNLTYLKNGWKSYLKMELKKYLLFIFPVINWFNFFCTIKKKWEIDKAKQERKLFWLFFHMKIAPKT